MKPATTLTSLVAAASLVGAFGLAYAQSTTTPAPMTTPQTQMGTTDTAPNTTGTMNNGTMAPGAGTPGTMQPQNQPMGNQPTDLPPQADRN